MGEGRPAEAPPEGYDPDAEGARIGGPGRAASDSSRSDRRRSGIQDDWQYGRRSRRRRSRSQGCQTDFPRAGRKQPGPGRTASGSQRRGSATRGGSCGKMAGLCVAWISGGRRREEMCIRVGDPGRAPAEAQDHAEPAAEPAERRLPHEVEREQRQDRRQGEILPRLAGGVAQRNRAAQVHATGIDRYPAILSCAPDADDVASDIICRLRIRQPADCWRCQRRGTADMRA